MPGKQLIRLRNYKCLGKIKKTKNLLPAKQAKRNHPEDEQKLIFIRDFPYRYPQLRVFIKGIEHEGYKKKLLAWRHKRLGLSAGIPDYLFLYNNGKYPCLWIEFKAGKNNLSKKQKEFFSLAESQGHKCVVVWSAQEAFREIDSYIIMK
jgi:hypothetical protein